MKRPSTARALTGAAISVSLLFSGCSSGSSGSPASSAGQTQAGQTQGSGSSETFSAAEVTAASGAAQVQPVFAVPKELPKPYTLGFIHTDATNAFFSQWVEGMTAAAKLYGVNYIQGDILTDDSKLIDVYNILKLKSPDIIGSQRVNPALVQQAQADDIPFLGLDAGTDVPGVKSLGIPDDEAGLKAADFLGPILKQKMDGPWKGKDLYYLGVSATPCDPCEKRILGGLEGLRTYVSIPDANFLHLTKAGDTSAIQSTVADVLTAHPDAVFAIIPLNDDYGIGAYQAFRAANRTEDAVGVTLGGDASGRKALLDPTLKGMALGIVDFNPYAEGWSWVEASIATLLNQPYQPYSINRILTPDNVGTAYPNG